MGKKGTGEVIKHGRGSRHSFVGASKSKNRREKKRKKKRIKETKKK